MSAENAIRDLYERLIRGWNAGDADAAAAPLAADGLMIGFDGSQMRGRDEVARELGRIFADHETAKYVTKVRSIQKLGADAALLHAVAGMVPPWGAEIVPERNVIQTLVARRDRHDWSVALFQNTPAQFHGRTELVEQLTEELSELLDRQLR